jgi:hypothetical protein
MMALTVEQLYQQYAGRAADPGGVAYFSQLFGSEIDPSEVARFQTAIAEARAQGSEPAPAPVYTPPPAPAAPTNLTVNDLYTQYAGRAADPSGVDYFSQLFGPTIEPDEITRFQTAIAEARAQGSEQAAAAPTNLTVNDLYTQYAGRAADPGGVDYFSQLFGPEVDSNEAARFRTAIAEARLQGTEPASAAQLAEARIRAEAAAREIARRQGAIDAQVRREDTAARLRAEGMLNPFANATQGMPAQSGLGVQGNTNPVIGAPQTFQQQFENYTSIPIGAQFNPNVVGGVGSPYSQIMSQMRPVGNPYAGVTAGQVIGGYNPNIYDPNLLNNFVRQRAAELAAAGMPAPLGFDGGGGDSGFGGGGGGVGGVGGVGGAGGPGSTSAADPSDFGAFNGGLITKVMGPNPPTPDDGTMFVQKGEYIVKKDAVNKYGKGLLDKINDGKIPAKKMKSLLG